MPLVRNISDVDLHVPLADVFFHAGETREVTDEQADLLAASAAFERVPETVEPAAPVEE